MFVLLILSRLFFFGVVGLPSVHVAPDSIDGLLMHLRDLSFGIALGIAFGISLGIIIGIIIVIVVGITGAIAKAFVFGMAVGIGLGIAGAIGFGTAFGIFERIALNLWFGITGAIALGISLGIATGIVFRISIEIARGIPAGIMATEIIPQIITQITAGIAVGIAAGIIAGDKEYGIATAIAFGMAIGITTVITSLRGFYLAPHVFFMWPKPRGQWYPKHPVVWDDLCSLPFPDLHRLLLSYAELFPEAGRAEIRRLIEGYPSQRMAALKANTMLIARQCAKVGRLTELPAIANTLPEGDKGFLRYTKRVRDMIMEISRLQTRLDVVNRPFFREPLARSLVSEIKGFLGRVDGLPEPLASEFRAAARNWLLIAESQWQEAQAVVAKTPTPQVFRAGDPVDRRQEAFVERISIIAELEGQIMLSSGCPGLLLYGRRRMGKTTMLRNLAAFLPAHVRVVIISMQNPQAFASLASLTGLVAEEIRSVCSGLDLPLNKPMDLSGMFKCLSAVDAALDAVHGRLVLGLDEYEQIDEKVGTGVFNIDLLAALRESIQYHRRITWLLAGSHHITELNHAPWPSYLASMRTIDVPLFTAEETRLLLTEPMKHSPLWDRDDSGRPSFNPTFWGEGGIERIHREAAGWPHLVQLIAETAVNLVNNSAVSKLDAAMMEQALDRAIVRGDSVLRLLMQTESTLPGEWDYLLGFRRHDTQAQPENEALYTSLQRRLLVVEENSQWMLRVPLMQRWLRQRG